MCGGRQCLCVVNVCSWQLVRYKKHYKSRMMEKHLCVVSSSFIWGAKLCTR